MGWSLIDPERSVVLERPQPSVEPGEFLRAPSHFPTGSGRFGHATGLAKQLANGAVEFSEPETRRFPRPVTPRRAAPGIGPRTVLAVSLALAFATWVAMQLVAS